MNTNFFKETITDKNVLKKFWDSKEDFIPLLKYIYETNHMEFSEPQKTGGSVFRVGDTIIKIAYPPEVKFKDSLTEYYGTELEAMKFCKSLGVITPDIICNGIIYDNLYSFPYIVTNYIDGIEANKAIENYNKYEKIEFYLKLKEIGNIIHVPTDINIPRYDDSNMIDYELARNLQRG